MSDVVHYLLTLKIHILENVYLDKKNYDKIGRQTHSPLKEGKRKNPKNVINPT